ncbi:MAG: hypothetical protein AB9917_18915 [Negativicutes bacterium]
MNDDALTKAECALRTVARRVHTTANVLDMCRFKDEVGQTVAAWGAVLDRQAKELTAVAAALRQMGDSRRE